MIIHTEEISEMIFTSVKQALIEIERSKDNEEKMLTSREVCNKLKISESTYRRYIKKGLIPSVKVGRQLRVRKAELEGIMMEYKSLKYKR